MRTRIIVATLSVLLVMVLKPQKIGAEPLISSDLLWLVNQEHYLEESYEPPVLKKTGGFQLHPDARDAFERMISAMSEDGISDLRIQSTYRTYAYQKQIFNNKKIMFLGLGYDEDTAVEMTSQSIAFPGASEHQTGLAVDVTVDGKLNRAFAKTDAGRWLDANCHQYGFIIRYQEEKTDITGIIYEPWHLRYVGNPHASFMKEQNLCLEEYMDYLKTNRMYMYWTSDTSYDLVMYTEDPESQNLRMVVDVSADAPNGNGFIITMKRYYPREFLEAWGGFSPRY